MHSSTLGRLGASLLIAGVTLGAAMGFVIQPLAGLWVLPRFGGDVWQEVNLVFQSASCLGFAVAWLLALRRGRGLGIVILVVSWAAALACLSFFDPRQFGSLGAFLAPFCFVTFVLSAAQVLLPYWFGRAHMPAWVDPYFVFAFVNLGAVVGTLAYPLAIQPWFTLREQLLGVSLGLTGVGLLWIASLSVLWITGRAAHASESDPALRPTWPRQLRWVALATLPAALALVQRTTPNVDVIPCAGLLPVILYQLTLIVAFARCPRNRPSVLSWTVQVAAVLACLSLLVVLGGAVGLGWLALALAGVVGIAMVPHHWTFVLHAIFSVPAVLVVWDIVEIPPMLQFAVAGSVVSAACWGCHGDLVADRPGPERLPQFLFFTGIAASLLAALSVQLLAMVPPSIAYSAAVLLPLAMRVFRRGAEVTAPTTTYQWVADTGAHVASGTRHAVFDKERRTKPAPSKQENEGG